MQALLSHYHNPVVACAPRCGMKRQVQLWLRRTFWNKSSYEFEPLHVCVEHGSTIPMALTLALLASPKCEFRNLFAENHLRLIQRYWGKPAG